MIIKTWLFPNARLSIVTHRTGTQKVTALSSTIMSFMIGVAIESKRGIMCLLASIICLMTLSCFGLKRLLSNSESLNNSYITKTEKLFRLHKKPPFKLALY